MSQRGGTVSMVLGALVACGNGNTGHLADAPAGGSADAAAHDAGPDAAPRPVTVIVTAGGAPVAGVVAYFIAADDTLVASTTTDASGHASALLGAGGSVTIIEPQQSGGLAPRDNLDTVEGAEPGDVYTFTFGAATSGASVPISLVVPRDQGSGIASYQLTTTCGSFDITPSAPGSGATNPPASLVLESCGSAADMLVVTLDAGGATRDWLYAPAVAVGSGQTVTLTGSYTPEQTLGLAYTGIPAGFTSLQTSVAVVADGGVLFNAGGVGSATAGSASFTLPTILAPGTKQYVATHFLSDGSVIDDQNVYQWGPPAATYTLPLAPLKDFTSGPILDPAAKRVTWSQTSTGVDADAVAVQLEVQRTAGIAHTWFWTIEAAGTTAGHVTVPTLPTDVFDYNVNGSDTFSVLNASTFSAPGGYAALRGIFGISPLALIDAAPSGIGQDTFEHAGAPALRHRWR